MKRAFFVVCIFIASMSLCSAEEQLSQMAKDMVKRHNELRAKHGCAPVKWNKDLAKFAQKWAETNASAGKMFHSKGSGYGENIFWTSRGSTTGRAPVDAWYSEIQFYDYKKPGFTMETGHFTQVVWKNSKEIGAGWAQAADGSLFVVCSYYPPGNFKGKFPQNVPPLDKSPSSAGLNKSHASAFAKTTTPAEKEPPTPKARTMPASNRTLLDRTLLEALQKLSDEKKLTPAPLNLSFTARRVILVEVEEESTLMFKAVGGDKKVPVEFKTLKFGDKATLALLVASLEPTSKDAQALAGVYMELLGNMQKASTYYAKAGAGASNKLASLFD